MKYLFFIFYFSSYILFAQNYVHQVLILNEGYLNYITQEMEFPVSVGSYNPITQIYNEVVIIDGARFASDIIIDDDYFYVAADAKILKYDLNSFDLVNEVDIVGVRNIAIYENYIFASRGEYDYANSGSFLFDSYLHVYEKDSLNLIHQVDTINGPKWSTQNIIINDGLVYVAINNGFEWGNEKGIVGILDGNTFEYISEIDLGENGKNPDNMMSDSGNIYTVNNKDWSGTSISEINIQTEEVLTKNISMVSTGCGTSCLRNGKIIYQISQETKLFEWEPNVSENQGEDLGDFSSFYGLAEETINNHFYASSTDYSSFGNINIYDQDFNLIHTFNVGVSPGNIVFDYRESPNFDLYEISNKKQYFNNYIFDLMGRVYNQNDIPFSGIYIQNGKKKFFNQKK